MPRFLPWKKPKAGVQIAGVDYSDNGGGGGSYVLPPATGSTLGGLIVGDGLDVDSDGRVSASGGGSYDFSTTEFSTGQKWIDGRDIYGIVITNVPRTDANNITFNISTDVDNIVTMFAKVFADSNEAEFMDYGYWDKDDHFLKFHTNRSIGTEGYGELIMFYTKGV